MQYCYHVDTVASAQVAENKSFLEFSMRQITHNFQVLSDRGYFIETKIKPLNCTKVCDGLTVERDQSFLLSVCNQVDSN